MGELQHQEPLGDGLDPGTDQGQTLPSDVSAKIADGEGGDELMEFPFCFDCRAQIFLGSLA
jgi:hypothetical protein